MTLYNELTGEMEDFSLIELEAMTPPTMTLCGLSWQARARDRRSRACPERAARQLRQPDPRQRH